MGPIGTVVNLLLDLGWIPNKATEREDPHDGVRFIFTGHGDCSEMHFYL